MKLTQEEQALYDIFRNLFFTHDNAIYSMRKLIDCKKRIDRKYIER